MEQLKCTKVIRSEMTVSGIRLGKDNNGKQMYERRKCGQPAAEYEIGGTLTTAKAVLCLNHKKQADRQSFVSSRGYGFNRIDRKISKKERIEIQERLPGTGVL